ncbi:MAG: sugar phosphate isomerase/epimerase [Planctomycetota bacterium]
MQVGILTSRMRDRSFEEVAKFAGKNGIKIMEVAAMKGGHLNVHDVVKDKGEAVKKILAANKTGISALACFCDVTAADAKARDENIDIVVTGIDAAKALGVGVVTALSGMARKDQIRSDTIKKEVPGAFKTIAAHAEKQGIKIALEPWWGTTLRNLDEWKLFFDLVPSKAVGLNFDPSHLYWQEIDIFAAIDEFGGRIYHTHAKDCEVKRHVVRRVGNQAERREAGWWRYTIPGFGGIRWGEYISALRGVGFDGALSIEHEDAKFDAEEGFLAGKKYLEQFV